MSDGGYGVLGRGQEASGYFGWLGLQTVALPTRRHGRPQNVLVHAWLSPCLKSSAFKPLTLARQQRFEHPFSSKIEDIGFATVLGKYYCLRELGQHPACHVPRWTFPELHVSVDNSFCL